MAKSIDVSDSSSSGDNTIITTITGKRQKVYRATISVESDITGAVLLKVGSTTIGKIRNPITGGPLVIFKDQYSRDEHGRIKENYYQGADGENIVLNLPDTTAVTLNLTHEEEFIDSVSQP